MYYLNKIAMGIANPMSVALLLLGAAVAVSFFASRRKSVSDGSRTLSRTARWLGLAAFAWLAVWSSPLLMPDIPRRLERMYPPARVETLPKADAIVLLGGGMSRDPEGESVYPEMHEGADRVWHAARLWKAGKAPLVFTSGTNETFSSVVLLRDLGVPETAIVLESESRNTEENARFVAETLRRRQLPSPRILLVTSAWHMRRALLMFRKYAPGIEVLPAACDYESLCQKDKVSYEAIFPSAECMADRTRSFKEVLGYWCYRFLRR